MAVRTPFAELRRYLALLGITATTTLTASGASTLTGAVSCLSTLDSAGDFSVATNKFTVAAASGNTAVAGTLAVTGATTLAAVAISGDVAVATNKFTVAAASGNTVVAGTLGVTGAATLSSTLAVTGATTLTGGLVASTLGRLSTVPVGSVAYGSFGTNTTPVAGTVYYTELEVPANKTVTGIGVLQGTAVGTDKAIVSLYHPTTGALLRSSALAGVTMTSTDAFQEYPLTATYDIVGPTKVWVGLQINGTTARFRSIAASTFLRWTGSAAGSFGTLPTITPPTTFAADKGPIAYVY